MKKPTRRSQKQDLPRLGISGFSSNQEKITTERALEIVSRKLERLLKYIEQHNLSSGIAECCQCGEFRPTVNMMILPECFGYERICVDRTECACNFIAGQDGEHDKELAVRLIEVATTPNMPMSGCWRSGHKGNTLWKIWSKELEGFSELAVEAMEKLP